MDNGRKTASNFFNSLLSKQAQVAPNTLPDHLREFDDVDKTRDLIYNNVLTSLTNKFPYSDGKHRLELHDVRYSGPQEYTWEEQKKALMNNRSLKTPVKGKWKLFDEETGELLDEKEEVVMDVPYYTQRGTIINNGSEYVVNNQSRLKPGMYTRTKQNGEHEAQFNVKPGTGRGFRLWMEPSTGVFMVNVGQANVPAYPFLKAQGVTDDQMQESWGDEVYQTNVQKSDSQAIGKLYTRFAGNKADNELPEEDKVKYLREAMLKAELDERVVQRTSGLEKTKNVTPELLLRTTNKLLNINRKQEDPDDRDAPEFSNILSVEDFVKERIEKDAGNTARTMLYNIRRDRNLNRVRRGALNSYMSSLILGSGLAQSIEETNPFQLMDQQNRIIKLGEGGIGSAETITDEARDVNNGQMGFIDPVAGPECFPYDDSVEVLTIDGWKAVTTITTEDKVACLSGNTTVFKNPERVIVNEYTGTMYGFKTPEIEQLVTPTHRNWIKPLGKEHKFRFKEAQSTYEQDCVIQGVEKQHRVTKEQHYTIEYNGNVFCLTVPGGIFMVRTNRCTGFWTGNSDKVGIDVRASFKSFKGNDQQIYAEFLDAKGKKIYLKPEDMTGKVLAFPGQDPTKKPEATAIKDGKMVQVPWSEVDYSVPSQAHMYFGGFNLTPLPTSFQPGRAFYASKYWSQYLPLTKGEVPLVQSKVPGEEKSFAEYYGRKTGAINSKVGGVVTKVTDAGVTVTDEEGKKHLYETVKDFPFNRITAVTYSAKVKPGDVVKPGDMIAHSNFTDKDTGAFNMGVNLKTAVVPYEAWSYEDAFVISEAAAKKLETERLMGFDKTTKGENIVNKNKFMSSFAKKFTKEQYDNIDDNGVAKPGTIVKYGDPIILAIGPKVLGKEDEKLGKLHKALRSAFKDDSVVWESKFPGVVTDVGVTSSGVKVNVKTSSPAQVGDKLSNLSASKGVIGKVVTDSEMPIDQVTGEPYEMLLNPMVVLSRVAPNQLAEMQLAKIAKKTGKPYVLPSEPPEEGWSSFAKAELDKNGMTAQNSIYDPLQGREIKNLGEGYMYISAFHHLAEKKLSGRDMVGGYTASAQPAKGGKTGAKRFCFPYAQQVWTEHGEMAIGHIVQNKLDVKVYAPDSNGIWGLHKVTNWFKRPGTTEELLTITVATTFDGDPSFRRGLYPTKKHEVYLYDGSKVTADQLIVGDTLITYSIKDGVLISSPSYVVAIEPSRTEVSNIDFYDIEVADVHRYCASNVVVSNSLMDINALLSHGATEVIKDAHLIRGTKNEDYWNTLRAGRPLPEPETPFIYDKFINTLKAGGINVTKEGDILTIMPMTNADIDKLSAGEIKNSRTVDIKNQDPAPGGLFDMAITGGANGKKFGHVTLAEPLPNPVMEEPIRRVLGLTVKQFHDVLTGREQLNGETGGKALRRALGAIDVDSEIVRYTNEIKTTRGARRDNAIKALRYLNAAKQQSISPTDWIIDKVPVIPPAFRPISNVGDMLKAADLNGLYRDVIETNNSIKELRNDIPDSELADEKLNLYKSVTAAFGLGEPITPDGVSKRWKGAIRQVIGTNPKCYDDATEILTENGWLPFPEYDDSRLQVATLNHQTNTLEFQNPTSILHEAYSGEMVHTKTRNLDLLVTAGHWHYVELQDTTSKDTKWLPPKKVQAGDLARGIAHQAKYIIGAANFKGRDFTYTFNGVVVSQDALAEFIGRYLIRGRVTKNFTVGLSRDSSASDVDAIEATVQMLGLPYKRITHTVTSARKVIRWEILSSEFGIWLSHTVGYGSRDLCIPNDITHWHKEHQLHLLSTYLGDPNRLPSKATWTTTSKGIVDSIELICTRIGYIFKASVVVPDVQWRCSIRKATKETVSYNFQTTVVSNWQGMVHCVTVPNGLIFVRRNGKVSVSGNTGMFQSNVLSKTVDSVGRGVIVPNPNLDMDTVGIPEAKAWVIYRPFIIREMVRRGIPQVKAIELIDNKDKEAKEVMLGVMDKRPVILDRAPTWHKFNLLAFKPVLTDTDTIQVSPLVTAGFNADFDGNCCIGSTYVTLQLDKNVCNVDTNEWYSKFISNLGKAPEVTADAVTVVTTIEKLPKVGTPKKDRNGADVYDVPPGVAILSYDHETGKPEYKAISHFTVEEGCNLVEVTTTTKSVKVSSNESLAIFDHTTGGLVKASPVGNVGMSVPVLVRPPHQGTKYDRDFGWLLGAFLSDGWVSGNMVGYAKSEDCKRTHFVDIVNKQFMSNFSVITYDGAKADDKLGTSKALHLNSKKLADAFRELDLCDENPDGCRQAITKRLPAKYLIEGSQEFLYGLLSGLIDGDGSVSISGTRHSVRFSTSSPGLKDGVEKLLYFLGLRYSTTTSPARGRSREAYTIVPSAVDLYEVLDKLTCVGELEQKSLESFKQHKPSPYKASDSTPLTDTEVSIIRPLFRKKGENSLYVRAAYKRLNTQLLKEFLTTLTATELVGLESLYARAFNKEVRWDVIVKVQDIPTETVYDVEVEGTKVFEVNNGLIIWDTANFHVPVSDKAVQQAWDKMTPSKNLFAINDLKTPQHTPSKEMVMGLYQLTRKPANKKPIVFTSIEEAKKAYKEGLINANDPIEIRGN